jgi:hypothetical protein
MWGKGISFQVSMWFITAYAVSGIFLFWMGAEIKRTHQKMTTTINPYRSVILGIIQSGLLFIATILQAAILMAS